MPGAALHNPRYRREDNRRRPLDASGLVAYLERVQTEPAVIVTRATVRARGFRGFLVAGTIDGLDFHGVVDFQKCKVLELSTDFASRPGCFTALQTEIVNAAARRAGVTL